MKAAFSLAESSSFGRVNYPLQAQLSVFSNDDRQRGYLTGCGFVAYMERTVRPVDKMLDREVLSSSFGSSKTYTLDQDEHIASATRRAFTHRFAT